MFRWFAILVVVFSASAVRAQPQMLLSAPKPGGPGNVMLVPVSQARAGAISETHRLLAFCHDRLHAEEHLSFVKLDPQGRPAPFVMSWKLPAFKVPEKIPQYAVSVAFHPKLPLLYVWQDLGFSYTNPPSPIVPPLVKDFDHLLIYRFDKEVPELVTSLCRGLELLYGMHGGALALDADAGHLYVPNLVEIKNPGSCRFGRFRLDADGLPVLDEADNKLPLPERLKKLAERNAQTNGVPSLRTPVEYVYLFPLSQWGCGQSFWPVSKDAVMAGNHQGVLTWRPDDPHVQAHQVSMKGSAQTLIAPHPKLPLVYATRANTDSLYLVGHFDGNLSLLPIQVTLPETRLFSDPVVMNKGKTLAIGGHYHLYFLDLDDEGRPRGEPLKTQILNPQARVLLYSERHDRLYVSVEPSK